MTGQEKIETKKKILDVAKRLFSQVGYDGTSIRQIADQSEVNIAAVNYHFGNKHGLYWSIIEQSMIWLENGVANVVKESKNIEELTRSLFQFLRSDEDSLRSTMKTLLTEGVPQPEDDHPYMAQLKKNAFGPPGGEHIKAFLENIYGKETSEEAVMWAVRSIFSNIVHWSTMCSTSKFQKLKKEIMSVQSIEDNAVHLANAVANYMCTNKKWD